TRNRAAARALLAPGTTESLLCRAVRLAQRTHTWSSHDPGGVAFLIPSPSPDHEHPARQPTPLPAYLCLGHDPRRHEPASANAVDGAFGYSNNADLCGRHPARCLPAVCTCGGPAHSPPPGDYLMNRVRLL